MQTHRLRRLADFKLSTEVREGDPKVTKKTFGWLGSSPASWQKILQEAGSGGSFRSTAGRARMPLSVLEYGH